MKRTDENGFLTLIFHVISGIRETIKLYKTKKNSYK